MYVRFEKGELISVDVGAGFTSTTASAHMHTLFCTQVQAWISPEGTPAIALPPPPALYAHVAGCEQCRATLRALAQMRLQAPIDVAQMTCDQCQTDLAAYIDIERDEGNETAVSVYPLVWWHLWTCADCAKTYEMVVGLQEAEALGELPPIPIASLVSGWQLRKGKPFMPILTLPRQWLVQSLVPQLGAAWGVGDGDTVIHEGDDDGYQISVSVRNRSGQWTIILSLDPPVIGDAVVTLGAESFRAPIDPRDIAVVGPIPASLLQDSTGPDMAIRVDPATP